MCANKIYIVINIIIIGNTFGIVFIKVLKILFKALIIFINRSNLKVAQSFSNL